MNYSSSDNDNLIFDNTEDEFLTKMINQRLKKRDSLEKEKLQSDKIKLDCDIIEINNNILSLIKQNPDILEDFNRTKEKLKIVDEINKKLNDSLSKKQKQLKQKNSTIYSAYIESLGEGMQELLDDKAEIDESSLLLQDQNPKSTLESSKEDLDISKPKTLQKRFLAS